MGNLTSLEVFSINRSGLTGEIPEELGNLSNLRIFFLEGDGGTLSGTVPASFASLTSLATFKIKGNNLSGKLPKLSSTLSSCVLGPVNNLTCYHPDNAVCAGYGVQGMLCRY
jgi:hypothetical protein